MCSESDYFRSKIESCPAAAKCVANAFYYSFPTLQSNFKNPKFNQTKGEL
jgi:hypothetical protein